MTTSKDVFAKRKEGDIDEAYRMALQLVDGPHVSDWDRKALCWCLIDLIKRDSASGNKTNLDHYCAQLEGQLRDPTPSFGFNSDQVLEKSAKYALLLCNQGWQQTASARALSKEGRHSEAAEQYRRAMAKGFIDREIQTSLGWELYKHSKGLASDMQANLVGIKRNLNEYLKLDIEKPSRLHSCVLQLATSLAGHEQFNMLAFCRLWDLSHLRNPEDFQRQLATGENLKNSPSERPVQREYPALAERIIQQASKRALDSGSGQDRQYILPYLDDAIRRYRDNIWLVFTRAKLLAVLGLSEDAMVSAQELLTTMPNDYRVWALIGDIAFVTDKEVAFSCYCKALSCSPDDKFTGGIRIKVAEEMVQRGELARAKCEVEAVIRAKQKDGFKIPVAVEKILSEPWFGQTISAGANADYYFKHVLAAAAFATKELPWIDACVGDAYTVPGKDNRPMRAIFIKTGDVPMRTEISASALSRMNLATGDPIRVKGKYDSTKRFVIFHVEPRESVASWDLFHETYAVISYVNAEKKLVHFVVASLKIHGVAMITDDHARFSEGDVISLKLSKSVAPSEIKNRLGKPLMSVLKYRGFQVSPASEDKAGDAKRFFCGSVMLSGKNGFTEDDVYIPPSLVEMYRIEDDQTVSGTAILSYNKKKDQLSWKAISISSVSPADNI